MARREDVKNLLTNMQTATDLKETPPKSSSYSNNTETQTEDSLRRHMDLTPYKQASVWPGRNYLLVGNSYNVETRLAGRTYDVKRRASIAMMFESKDHKRNRGCVTLADALRNQGFIEVMSRFEFDWLRRMPDETLIGPAYDRYGNLIPQAFSVWRPEGVTSRTRPHNHEEKGNNYEQKTRGEERRTRNASKKEQKQKRVLTGAGKR